MKLLCVIAALVGLATAASADVRKVRPDGHIKFVAAMEGPTRISVEGDRIKDIIQTDSQFEMVNDEGTGDVFLRFIGASPDPESGYIITEAGHTVGFTMTPRAGLDNQTVIIRLIGVERKSDSVVSADSGGSSSGFEVSHGSGSSYASGLTEVVRAAILEKIGTRQAGKYKSRSTVGTVRKGILTGRAFAVPALSGARPAPQSFFTNRTLAVWVDDVPTSGKYWVVVVEQRR